MFSLLLHDGTRMIQPGNVAKLQIKPLELARLSFVPAECYGLDCLMLSIGFLEQRVRQDVNTWQKQMSQVRVRRKALLGSP